MTCDEIIATKVNKTIIGNGKINFDYEDDIIITCDNVTYKLEEQKIFFNNKQITYAFPYQVDEYSRT